MKCLQGQIDCPLINCLGTKLSFKMISLRTWIVLQGWIYCLSRDNCPWINCGEKLSLKMNRPQVGPYDCLQGQIAHGSIGRGQTYLEQSSCTNCPPGTNVAIVGTNCPWRWTVLRHELSSRVKLSIDELSGCLETSLVMNSPRIWIVCMNKLSMILLSGDKLTWRWTILRAKWNELSADKLTLKTNCHHQGWTVLSIHQMTTFPWPNWGRFVCGTIRPLKRSQCSKKKDVMFVSCRPSPDMSICLLIIYHSAFRPRGGGGGVSPCMSLLPHVRSNFCDLGDFLP
jgi:hypothetical protein